MEKTKVISACDTIHDFDLKNNQFYDAFVQEHNIPTSGKIEKYIMNYMNIDKNDNNETIDLEYVRQTNLPYFTSRTYDITSDDFKHILWSMCNSHYQPNEDITIIADANVLPYSLLCNFGNEIKTPKLLLTEATKYDRLIDKPTECFQNRPITASLFKSNGNLFGLNFINVGTTNDGKQMINYSYNNNDVIQVDLDKYVYEQQQGEKKLKSFLANVVTNMYQRYFNKKRKEPQMLTHTTDLLTLLNKVEKVYKLKHTDFGFYDKDTDTITFDEYSKQFVNILFDFKRAGDQLQVESAKQSNSIFISGDQLAIAYAYHIGIPCIKPSRFGSSKKNNNDIVEIDDNDDDNEPEKKDTRRKLVYYNLSKDAVINALDNKEYYSKMIDILFKQLEEYSDFLSTISQLYNTEEIERIKSLMLNAIHKSIDMLKLNPKQDKERVSARSKVHTNDTNKSMYKYRYFHKFNILMHGFLCTVLNHIVFLDNTEKEYKQHKLEYQTSDKSIDSLKTMYNKMENNVTYKFIKFLNINDDADINKDYIQLIFRYYNRSFYKINILYDKQDPTLNLYTMMEPKISISDYILANTAKHPDLKSKPLNKQKNEINTLIFKQYNETIDDVIMDIQLAMPIFHNFLDLKNELEKQSSLQKQQSFFAIDGDSNGDGELDTKIAKITLETFMQSDLENDKSKVSKLLRQINEDISEYKDMIDSLFKPNFVDEFILEPEPLHNQVQSGGDEQPTHYKLFVKELDYIYNNRDAVTNDFTKLLLIFFAKSSDIFRTNGTFSKSFTKYYCRRLTSLRSRTNSVIKSLSKRSTVSTPVSKPKSVKSSSSVASTLKSKSVKASSSKRSTASAASTIEPIRKYNSKLQSSSTFSAASTLKQNSQRKETQKIII